MAYTFDQIFAADPSNPENVAGGASVLIFAPGDTTMTPLTITTPDGAPLANPVPTNANGFGSAFAHATLDRVAWSGGGFTGFFTSYEGMKQVAIAAQDAANGAAQEAASSAASAQASANLVNAPADLAVSTLLSDAASSTVAATYNVIDARATQPITYYVDPAGSDSNDGASSTKPFQTIQKAFDQLLGRGFISGTCTINLAAGTYAPAILGSGISSKSFITVQGPAVGHPNVPTAIVDIGGVNNGVGLSAPEGSKLSVKNVRITNGVGTLSIGLQAGNDSDIYAENVHTDNIYSGIQVTNNSRLRQKGGISSCTIGTAVGVSSVFTIGYSNGGSTAGGPRFNGCYQGVKISELSSGHVDYCIMDGCQVGIEVSQHSRVNDVSNDIRNSTIAAIRGTKSCYANAGNVFTNNVTNFINDSFTSYLPIATGAQGAQRVGRSYAAITHTGTTTKTQLLMPFTVPAGYFTDDSKRIDVTIRGKFNTTGVATIGVDFGAGTISGLASSGTTSNALYEAVVTIYPTGATSQKVVGKLTQGTALVRHDLATRAANMAVSVPVYVVGTLSDAAGTLTVETVEVSLVG